MLRFLFLLLALPLGLLAQPSAPAPARPDTRQLLPVPTSFSWGKSRLTWQAPLRLNVTGPAEPTIRPAAERLLAGEPWPSAGVPLDEVTRRRLGRHKAQRD